MSADTSILCTQPTWVFCNVLIFNYLQKHGVGRHLEKMHSADIPHPTSPHPTSPHPTSPHPTSPHPTSPHPPLHIHLSTIHPSNLPLTVATHSVLHNQSPNRPAPDIYWGCTQPTSHIHPPHPPSTSPPPPPTLPIPPLYLPPFRIHPSGGSSADNAGDYFSSWLTTSRRGRPMILASCLAEQLNWRRRSFMILPRISLDSSVRLNDS